MKTSKTRIEKNEHGSLHFDSLSSTDEGQNSVILKCSVNKPGLHIWSERLLDGYVGTLFLTRAIGWHHVIPKMEGDLQTSF